METKFLANGAEVEVIAKTPAGFLVVPIYDGDEGSQTDYDAPFNADKVYDKPPTEKLNAEIAALQERIRELSAERNTLSGDVRDLEAKINARKDAIKQHEKLKHLEDFIAGKITHYVETCGYDAPKIVEFSKSFSDGSNEYDRPRALKLLTLFGKSNGDLNWNLGQYYDGSGHSPNVFVARSLEEAIEFIKGYIAQQAIETADRPRDWVIKTAQKYSVQLPDGYVEKHNAGCLESIRTNIANTQKSLEGYQLELGKYLPVAPPTNLQSVNSVNP